MSDRDRFDKFTQRARKVLSLAQEEAQRFQHNYIGSEHILLGLVREGEGAAAKVLVGLGVELNKVRSAVEFIIGRGDRIVLGEIGLTPRAKKIVELAVDEARRLNHHYIGTEHLLLGLVREGEGIGAGVLESLGVNLEKVRAQTLQVLGHSQDDQEPIEIFTEQAKQVIVLAQEEARSFQHKSVRTEHLLLGLLRQNGGDAVHVLHGLGVDLGSVRDAVEFVIGYGDSTILGEIGLNPSAKKVVDGAAQEARGLKQDKVVPAHILLRLVRESDSIGAGLLEALSVNPALVYEQTLQILVSNYGDSVQKVSRQELVLSWRTEPEIDAKRQAYLAHRLSIASSASIATYLNADEAKGKLDVLQRELEIVLRDKEQAIQQKEWELAADLLAREASLLMHTASLEAKPGTNWPHEQDAYPFKDIKLTRADIEWLLVTHNAGSGPIGWSDQSQDACEGLDLRGTDLSKADLHGLPLTRMRGGREWSAIAGIHLERADLSEAHLEGANLFWAHLEGANLSGAHLQGANLSGAHLQGANLTAAHLEDANLSEAHMEQVDFTNANLGGANFFWSHLEGTDLTNTHLEGAYLDEAYLE